MTSIRQTRFVPGLHIEMMAAKLEAYRQGMIIRLISNLPPATSNRIALVDGI
jgi:hypothetical protein